MSERRKAPSGSEGATPEIGLRSLTLDDGGDESGANVRDRAAVLVPAIDFASAAPLPPTALAIVESAARLFALKGFSSTSIREIALAAGVTKPTIYYYFGSKQGLIQHLLGSSMRGFQETLDAALALSSLDVALTHLLQNQLQFADERPATVTLLARLDMMPEDEIAPFELHAAREKSNVALATLFMRAMERGEIRTQDPALVTASFIGALVVHLMMRIQRPDIQLGSSADAAQSIVRLFLDGAKPR
jgi:AcrR family transcriptional regulator